MESGLEGRMRLRWKEMEFQGEVRAGVPLGGGCGQVAAPLGGAHARGHVEGPGALMMDVPEASGAGERAHSCAYQEGMMVARRSVACSQCQCAFSTSHSSCCETCVIVPLVGTHSGLATS